MRTIARLLSHGLLTFLLLAPGAALAQGDLGYQCDEGCGSPTQSGTPEQSGGGSVPFESVCYCSDGDGGSILLANTDLNDTYQHADDYDSDGLADPHDNCAWLHNPDQSDADGDGVGDSCDNCLADANSKQLDSDRDVVGNLCDLDIDGDGHLNTADNCPTVYYPGQKDTDGDGVGDACDPDIDGDELTNLVDPCPTDPDITEPTVEQLDFCFPDTDGDGVSEVDPLRADNCPMVYNPCQEDTDDDDLGNACDSDLDGDGVPYPVDNCDEAPNRAQLDADRDGRGDECDSDYCYVVFGNEANCLDPTAWLSVYVPALLANTGETFRLPFFVNRTDQPLHYHWGVAGAPLGSHAEVANFQGYLDKTVNHETLYQDGNVATFTPDMPGYYRIRITAATQGADPVTGEVNAHADYVMTLSVIGAPPGRGCSISTASSRSAPLWLVLAAFVLAVRRRRH